MKIGVIGGGPAGLYFAILMKRADPAHEVEVWERNAPDDTFGWGVVFSEETLANLAEADRESFRRIADTFATWDEIDVHYKGEVIRSGGHGFCGIGRVALLKVLQERAAELDVPVHYGVEVTDLERFADCDLVVAADGINSRHREAHRDAFGTTIDVRKSVYIWLGTTRPFEAFTFFMRANEHGFFTVHAYQFDAERSTFIVETDEESWRNAGLDAASIDTTVSYLEGLFAEDLAGHPLLVNKSEWIRFRTVRNERWHVDNLVLMGDAAHTAHFSIGSGTKLAMEDSIALARALREHGEVPAALAEYEAERKWYSESLQRAAQDSLEWFETIKRRSHFEPMQLAYSLMVRSNRLGHDKLWLRDEEYVARVNRWFAERAGVEVPGGAEAPPPMFTPLRLREVELANRVAVSPMCMYSAEDGTIQDWHLVHLGSRAIGGAGLVMTEMTDVGRDGRITPGCAGMYLPEHVIEWRRVVDFVHRWSGARIGMQLAHAGQKGSTRRPWEGADEPLEAGGWELLAASAQPYGPHSPVPKAMDRDDMDRVRGDFLRAAQWADDAGFDLIELHMAHGYLLASFLSPLTNRRTDEYGGGIGNRMRYPLEIFEAVRSAWPEAKPIAVRVSATDWIEGGQTTEDTIAVARALKERGCDLIDVSSGFSTPEAVPEFKRLFQVPLAERIRHEAGIPTMAVGAISRHGDVNAILASGAADLCAIARGHLFDPYFTLRAAAEQQFHDVAWPDQYLPARPQPRERLPWLERERRRRRRLL